jgi:predicted amidohydrolase YtcJ
MMHANGDAAIDQCLDMYRTVFGTVKKEEAYTGVGFRGRVEHCTIAREDQIAQVRLALETLP